MTEDEAYDEGEELPLLPSGPQRKDIDIDTLLMLIENPIRRKILELLATETHYPLQLSKELNVSQQAIMKHLKVLEDKGLVRSFEERSTSGGPPRKSYIPTRHLSLRIDIGPNTFVSEMRDLDQSSKEQPQDRYSHIDDKVEAILAERDPHQMLAGLSKSVEQMNKEIQGLEDDRDYLVWRREQVLREIYAIVGRMASSYDERKVMYYVIRRNDTSMEGISEALDMRMAVLRRLMEQMEQEQLLFWGRE